MNPLSRRDVYCLRWHSVLKRGRCGGKPKRVPNEEAAGPETRYLHGRLEYRQRCTLPKLVLDGRRHFCSSGWPLSRSTDLRSPGACLTQPPPIESRPMQPTKSCRSKGSPKCAARSSEPRPTGIWAIRGGTTWSFPAHRRRTLATSLRPEISDLPRRSTPSDLLTRSIRSRS